MNVLKSCVRERLAMWPTILAIVAVATAASTIVGGEPARRVSRVVKLTHIAVILPELDETRMAWECDLWTPTLDEVIAAEKAIVDHLKTLSKAGATVEGMRIEPTAHYVIQYSGITREKQRWIVCSVLHLKAIQRAAEASQDDLAETLESVLTIPYLEYDAGTWFDMLYEPSTKKLSRSLGDVSRTPMSRPATPQKSKDSQRKTGSHKLAPSQGKQP